ncbi:MAG: FGGY-family carbohydrate kinase [Pseudomonadota bacterium]
MIAIGVDLGTSGVRAAALSPERQVLAMTRGAYGAGAEAGSTPEGWWSATQEALRALVAELEARGHSADAITGLSVDGTSGTVLLADAALRPVGRALMYHQSGFDAEAARIADVAPDPHIARGSGSALARVLRLLAEDADGAATQVLHQADYIAARLRGQGGRTDFNNALKTGLDPMTGTWPEWIAELGGPAAQLPAMLPAAQAPGTPFGPIDADVAQSLGLPPQLNLHAGTTDSIAAFLASAPQSPGAAVTSLGTTLAIKLFSPVRIDAPEMGLYAHRMGGGWLVGGASNTGAGVLRHFFTVEALEGLSAEIDPDTESPLDYYPLLAPGERFPVNDPAYPPRMTPRPESDAAFLHGLLESMARIEKRCYDRLRDLGAPAPDRILTAGGGASNAVWTRIRSRVLGLPVARAEMSEACIGAASLALPPPA